MVGEKTRLWVTGAVGEDDARVRAYGGELRACVSPLRATKETSSQARGEESARCARPPLSAAHLFSRDDGGAGRARGSRRGISASPARRPRASGRPRSASRPALRGALGSGTRGPAAREECSNSVLDTPYCVSASLYRQRHALLSLETEREMFPNKKAVSLMGRLASFAEVGEVGHVSLGAREVRAFDLATISLSRDVF